jgi:hypothetical protein
LIIFIFKKIAGLPNVGFWFFIGEGFGIRMEHFPRRRTIRRVRGFQMGKSGSFNGREVRRRRRGARGIFWSKRAYGNKENVSW